MLLWSGTRIFGTLTQALNIAFDVDDVYGFWKWRLAELLMLLSVGVVFVLDLLAPLVLDLAGDTLSFLHIENAPLDWLVTGAAPVVLVLVAFFLPYRFAPASIRVLNRLELVRHPSALGMQVTQYDPHRTYTARLVALLETVLAGDAATVRHLLPTRRPDGCVRSQSTHLRLRTLVRGLPAVLPAASPPQPTA